MKILILTCSTGGGHNSCAKYILEGAREKGIEADRVDFLSLASEKTSKIVENLYLGSTKGEGKVFKNLYKLGEAYDRTKVTSPVYLANKALSKRLSEYIKENGYNIIICTHLFPSQAVTSLKKKENITLINVATDYHVIPFWDETNPNYFVIPSKLLKDEFISFGFKEETLLPYGIPVSKNLLNYKKLDFKTDKKKVLLTSGSMGFGKIEDIVKDLLEKLDIYLIVICGTNKDLYEKLTKINNPNLLVKGFVNNMNDYIYSSDLILSKPGGLTTTEISVINKPFIHIMPIPGVEDYNAKFFKENKMSLVCNTVDEIVETTRDLLNDHDLQKTLMENQRENINADSVDNLLDFLKEHYK